MTKTILFLHSAGPQGPQQGSHGLVTYLSAMLGPNFTLVCPAMPEPDNPSYEPWRAEVAKELANLDGEVLIVGHSLGGAVVLKHLSENVCKARIAGVFLVAVPFWGLDADWQHPDFTLAADFTATLPPLSRIHLYHCHDDKIVPFAHAEQYARKLPQATFQSLTGSDHVFAAGLPELAADIKDV